MPEANACTPSGECKCEPINETILISINHRLPLNYKKKTQLL